MKREELLALARRHMWAAWQLSSEELASQAAETLLGLGMLVPEGGAQELERLRSENATLSGDLREALTQSEALESRLAVVERAPVSLSPATDELEALRARVAELEARDAALLTVMERVRDAAGDVMGTYDKPSAPGCSVWGLLSDLAVVRGLNRAPEHNQWSGAPYPEEPDDGAFEEASTHAEFVLPPAPGPSAEEQPDALTATFVPLQALREDVYESPLRHPYRTPHDLPEPGAPYGRDDCPVCKLSIPLTSAGVLCFHGECDGGGKVPAESGGAPC